MNNLTVICSIADYASVPVSGRRMDQQHNGKEKMNNLKVIQRTREQAFEHWIDALESGRYRRGVGQLRQWNGSRTIFCCLGVLCDLAAKDGGEQWSGEYFQGSPYGLSEQMAQFMGIDEDQLCKLVTMNDDDKLSFKKIAAHIRHTIMPAALQRT